MNTKSSALFARAKQYIPGGVNSPVRACQSVQMDPIFIEKAKGSRITDADGNEYIDYVGSWGPLILGHADERITGAIVRAAEKGTSYGACTEAEVRLAELITQIYPSMDQVRMVSSGTEATMSAVRLARGYTSRSKIIKFEGNYHGHADSFLIKAGSGVLTLGIPGSPGITRGIAQDTLIARYNDIQSVEELIEANEREIAAVIIEPVMGNAGVIPPAPGFLEKLRAITESNDIVLIFDEVITGFRVALGGAQERYGITPDLTTLGKIIGGGLPVGAFGGKKEIMDKLAPSGPVYQAGTLSGNPIAMAAGFETLAILKEEGFYQSLEAKAVLLEQGLEDNLEKLGLAYTMNRIGSMSCFFFTQENVDSYDKMMTCDTDRFTVYFKEMLKQGIYLAPSQFEAAFISAAHTHADLEQTIQAHLNALKAIH